MTTKQKTSNQELAIIAFQKEVANQLVAGGHIKDATDINLNDLTSKLVDIMSQGNKKTEASYYESNFQTINREIFTLILYHFNSMKDRSAVSNSGIEFVNKPIYGHLTFTTSTEVGTEEKTQSVLFSHSSPVYNYMHGMFKMLLPDDNKLSEYIKPAIPFTFSKKIYKKITATDILTNFKYSKDGQQILPTKLLEGKAVQNEDAVNIFQQEITKFEAIIKKVFQTYYSQCEVIVDSEISDMALTCGTIFGDFANGFNADYMMSMHLCQKIFLYAQNNPNLCVESDFESSSNIMQNTLGEDDVITSYQLGAIEGDL